VENTRSKSRRELLKFLLCSPLMASAGAGISSTGHVYRPDPDLEYLLSQNHPIITNPNDALNIFDLERVARNNLPSAHYGYIATGVRDVVA